MSLRTLTPTPDKWKSNKIVFKDVHTEKEMGSFEIKNGKIINVTNCAKDFVGSLQKMKDATDEKVFQYFAPTWTNLFEYTDWG